jgi:teichuronic acid biosynthesis glycosyltransferase TuaG
MPAYNTAGTLLDSIRSVQAQTESNWELLLVVDRNSQDETLQLAEAEAAKDQRIRLIKDLPEGGCAYNRNQALKAATGDFISFLDSDDLWLAEKLEKQLKLVQSTGCHLSYTGYRHMDKAGVPLPCIITPPSQLTYQDLLKDNLLGCLTVMIRRARFPELQFVDFLHEDYILWLQLIREAPAQGLSETLALYRVAPTSRSGNKAKAAVARWRILREFEHLPLTTAVPAFAHYIYNALSRRSSGA